MFTREPLIFAAVLALGSSIAFAQTPNLGKPISQAEITAWDISILPAGTGLPPGGGTPTQGAPERQMSRRTSVVQIMTVLTRD